MTQKPWRGSFAIPMTPFDENDAIDVDVLAAEIEFCIECGVGGIAAPLMVSEFQNLSEEERKLMVRVAVEVAGGRVPVIANVAAVNTPLAVAYATYAQKLGVDGVIAMPPYIYKPDFPSIKAYYQAISDAVDVPVWIQNASVAPLSPDQLVTLCEEIEHVSWVKEEVPPSHKNITALLSKGSSAVKGVMGGVAAAGVRRARARRRWERPRMSVLRPRPARLGASRCRRHGGCGRSLRRAVAVADVGGDDGDGLRQGDHDPARGVQESSCAWERPASG